MAILRLVPRLPDLTFPNAGRGVRSRMKRKIRGKEGKNMIKGKENEKIEWKEEVKGGIE